MNHEKNTLMTNLNPFKVQVSRAQKFADIPTQKEFLNWVSIALRNKCKKGMISIRIVGEEEGQQLNHHYREKNKATNILSFPCNIPMATRYPLIGDLVFCESVIRREALEQKKPIKAHWAHLTIHGTLHLIGYDHELPKDAEQMEQIEVQLLAELELPNPYEEAVSYE